MLQPYRAPNGSVRVFDTDARAVLPVNDPRAARFLAMSDRELQLAGGYGRAPGAPPSDPDAPVVVDLPIPFASRGRTTSTIVHAPVAPALTEAERAVCRQLGVSEADYLETKRRQPNKWASEPLEH